MNKRILILLAVVWVAALGLVGFSELRPGGGAQGSGKETSLSSPKEQGQAESQASAGKADHGARGGSVSDASAGPGGSGRSGVVLRVEGGRGTEFSGRCTVDGEEREIGGRAPQTYSYEPDKRLECEITNSGRGPLQVTFSDGAGTSSTQRFGPGPGTLELAYSGGGLSVSTRSNSQTSSSQTSSSSQVSGSR